MPWFDLPTADGANRDEPIAVASLLDRVMAGLGGPSPDVLVVVHERWPDVVGEEVVSHARPLGIHEGTLTIGTDSAAWASHLRWSQTEILGRLEAMVGAGVVTEVKVRVVSS